MPVRPLNREQGWLLARSLEELLPQDYPARFVGAFVDQIDAKAWTEPSVLEQGEERGAPAYHRRLLLSVWLYGFMTGVRSSRKLESACREQLPYLWLTGLQTPAACRSCPAFGQCAKDYRHGRALEIGVDEAAIGRHRGIMATAASTAGAKSLLNPASASSRNSKQADGHYCVDCETWMPSGCPGRSLQPQDHGANLAQRYLAPPYQHPHLAPIYPGVSLQSSTRPLNLDGTNSETGSALLLARPREVCTRLGRTIFWDVRRREEYEGTEPVNNSRPGHIPGAIHLEWTELLDPETRTLKTAVELKELLGSRGITPESEINCY